MDRVQLFEFEDLPWFPQVVRECMTDFLSFLGQRGGGVYASFAERLASAVQATGDDTLLDLCSGGGGPALTIVGLLRNQYATPLRVVLTDLYPNLPRLQRARAEGGGNVEFRDHPVDATAVPESLPGFRLICNAFHHLPPSLARKCLADAVTQGRGIALVEMVDRSAVSLFGVTVGTSAVLAVTPFIQPVRVSRLLLTYLLPVVPLCTWWDGMVSCLRAYRPEELTRLVASLPGNDYVWDIGRLPVAYAPVSLVYLIGRPRAAGAVS
ncbi:MAG: class I SAM-dependent methyltransferase [Pseudomonadota bacterium]